MNINDITGWYEIGQRWKLWKDGQLRDFYIDHIHVLESDDPDNKIGRASCRERVSIDV